MLQTVVVGALVGLTMAKTPTNFVVLFMDDNGWGDRRSFSYSL